MKALQAKLPALLEKAIETAAQRAVEKAIELTPPTGDDLSGTHTRTGEMKQHWAGDSQTKPQRQGDELTAVLANDVEYASYVDQGHRMDRHFVPGLYINPATGQLEYDPKAAGTGLLASSWGQRPSMSPVNSSWMPPRRSTAKPFGRS